MSLKELVQVDVVETLLALQCAKESPDIWVMT